MLVFAATMWPLAAHAQSSATGFSPPAPRDVAFITGFHAAHPDVPGDVRYEGIVLKRESRVPEPAITIRFDELARLQRDERGGGLSVGKAVGIGLAAGAGAILTLFAILFSLDD